MALRSDSEDHTQLVPRPRRTCPLPSRTCALEECGRSFVPGRSNQVYHSPECRRRAGARRSQMGSVSRRRGVRPATVGALNLWRVAVDLALQRFAVYTALSAECPSDLLAEGPGGRLLRVEVVTAHTRGRKVYLPRVPESRRYDVLAVVTEQEIRYEPTLVQALNGTDAGPTGH